MAFLRAERGSRFTYPGFRPDHISGLELWLRPDTGILDASGDPCANNDKVATWEDQSGNGNDATQGTDANRPVFKTNQINGQPALDCDDAASQHLVLTGMTVASGDLTGCAALNGDDTITTQRVFSAGALVVAMAFSQNGDDVQFWDDGANAWRGAQNATTGAQVLTWVQKAAAAGAIYRDGAALDTGLTVAQAAVGGDVVIGGAHDGTNTFSGLISEFCLYSRALSTAELASIHNYMGRYGTI